MWGVGEDAVAVAQTHPRVARTSAGVTIAPRRPRTVVDWVASETQFNRLMGSLETKYIHTHRFTTRIHTYS